ncbi:queuine tRNA-ribosyltransferase subunit qtrtd1 [Phtheirospermum japonicum]|uniref:Queuine tRNA-ribosyltransferase subunit qtrtd1 n=1 Tax=Phtheirospermum japonicum TaxID=374723 RepID=A0A830BJX8_9LAMI|nr:queuine tRNA-ribosyltransferase subunit qtrtd1 [Phtheirospermum japonicum]
MKFSVKAWSKGGARAGVLQVGSCSIETPALLINTRKGLPAFISPDLLSSLPTPDSRLFQFSPLHFSEGISMKTISDLGGLHQMIGLHEHVFSAVPRDPILSIPDYQSSNKLGASFETPCGRLLINPQKYMEMISSMKPNMWATLADEVPAWVSEKRNRASVDRTLRWLDDCLTSSFGFCLGGFGLGESMDERPSLLSAITEILPEDKPRQICGLGLPEEVLQGVAAGVDLFDSTHNTHHYIGFFRAIREAIKGGAFEEFCRNFVETRRDHILAVALNA